MRRLLTPIRLLAISAACLAPLAHAHAHAGDLADVVARIKPSIVAVGTVELTRQPQSLFVGTGFVVGNGHYAITNAHVLPEKLNEDRREYLAVFSPTQDRSAREARVLATDPTHDLALIAFSGAALPAFELAPDGNVREGDLYAFTGFPIGMVLGVRPVTHRGIISAITPIVDPQLSARTLDAAVIQRLSEPYEVYQLDATAYPGNSGSPLYHPESGLVIGVINKVFVKESKETLLERPSGITYAIPVAHVRAMMRKAGVSP